MKQERINEIANECVDELQISIRPRDAIAACNLFISRICEEQEPAGYKSLSGECASSLAGMILARIEGPFTPLFTIPPSAPDCKELVEALEKIDKWRGLTIPEARGIAEEAIAKHKASMGEEE